jgi:hypothetical protein
MVKLFCNRCEAEIKDKYYTINFNVYEVNPKPEDYLTTCAANAYSASRDGVLAQLNSQKMYCNNCKEAIEKFINSELLDLPKPNPCSGCVYEDEDGSTVAIERCVCCNRVNGKARYDYYLCKNKVK